MILYYFCSLFKARVVRTTRLRNNPNDPDDGTSQSDDPANDAMASDDIIEEQENDPLSEYPRPIEIKQERCSEEEEEDQEDEIYSTDSDIISDSEAEEESIISSEDEDEPPRAKRGRSKPEPMRVDTNRDRSKSEPMRVDIKQEVPQDPVKTSDNNPAQVYTDTLHDDGLDLPVDFVTVDVPAEEVNMEEEENRDMINYDSQNERKIKVEDTSEDGASENPMPIEIKQELYFEDPDSQDRDPLIFSDDSDESTEDMTGGEEASEDDENQSVASANNDLMNSKSQSGFNDEAHDAIEIKEEICYEDPVSEDQNQIWHPNSTTVVSEPEAEDIT